MSEYRSRLPYRQPPTLLNYIVVPVAIIAVIGFILALIF